MTLSQLIAVRCNSGLPLSTAVASVNGRHIELYLDDVEDKWRKSCRYIRVVVILPSRAIGDGDDRVSVSE